MHGVVRCTGWMGRLLGWDFSTLSSQRVGKTGGNGGRDSGDEVRRIRAARRGQQIRRAMSNAERTTLRVRVHVIQTDDRNFPHAGAGLRLISTDASQGKLGVDRVLSRIATVAAVTSTPAREFDAVVSPR